MVRMFIAIFGHAFFGHNSAKFLRETIIYRLVMRNPSYEAYFWIFGGKIGVATTRAPNGSGHPNPIKKLAPWVDLLGQPLFRNHSFDISRGRLMKTQEIVYQPWSRMWIILARGGSPIERIKVWYNIATDGNDLQQIKRCN